MNLGGILAGALGGGATAVNEIANQTLKRNEQSETMRAIQQMDLEKQQRLLEMRQQAENDARVQMVDRIAGAKRGLIDTAMEAKYPGASTAGLVSGESGGPSDTGLGFSDARQEAARTAMAPERAAMEADPELNTKAAIATGDIDPKSAATMNSREQIAQAKYEELKRRSEDSRLSAQERMDLQLQLKEMDIKSREGIAQARVDASGNSGIDARLQYNNVTRLVQENRKEARNLRTLMADPMVMANKPAIARYESQLQELEDEKKSLMTEQEELGKQLGARSKAPAGLIGGSGATDSKATGLIGTGGTSTTDRQISSGTQSTRDADAGKQMIMNEYGGDVERAKRELAQMELGVKAAPASAAANEAKSMLQSQANRLRAGIQAMSGATATAAPTSTAAVVTVTTKAQYDALPSGTTFTAPDGTKRVKP